MNPPTAITSRADFARAVHWFVDSALERNARTLHALDPDFADWPLDDAALLAKLTPWLKLPGRRLVLVAADWTRVTRDHPRFAGWRVPWAHAVETRRAQEEDAAELITALFDDGPLCVQVVDKERWRGRSSRDPLDAHLLRERFDALTQRSSPDFPPTTLGL